MLGAAKALIGPELDFETGTEVCRYFVYFYLIKKINMVSQLHQQQ